jgi:hypothetical protein
MPPQKPRRPRARTILLSILGALVAQAASNNPAAAASSTSPAAASSNPGATKQAASQPTTQPVVQPTTKAPPPPPQMTVSQQSAIQAAENYLQAEPGWSYQGLINQLDSPDGSGFSVADATFAVNHLSPTPNWDQQAALAAQNYMTAEGGFSACSMVQQLDSPDGDNFTQAQAEYGAKAVGLGSC